MRPALLSRRNLLLALGVVWFLDGCLQLQPHMWTQAFFANMFESANVSLPSWLTTTEVHLNTWVSPHPAPWDVAFSGLELAIGLALAVGRGVRTALAASILGSVGVWLLGEGLGGVTLSGANAMSGAPGPACLYALAALILWPRGQDRGNAVADSGLLGPWGSRWAWFALWTGTALLWLESQNHMAQGPGGQLGGIGNGEPGWVASANQAIGSAVGSHGLALAALLGAAQLACGVGVLAGPVRRLALILAGALAVFFGVLGQDLGGLLTGQATDPGTAPVLLIMAGALWPLGLQPTADAGDRRDRGATAGQRMIPV